MAEKRACKRCKTIVTTDKCPCGGNTTKEWQGYLLVLDSKESEIAKMAGIEKNGAYALRV